MGEEEGIFVGDDDGCVEGINVGIFVDVGKEECTSVGTDVGVELGKTLGSDVGIADGKKEGKAVGDVVGGGVHPHSSSIYITTRA